jgi:hypothetical protein
VRSRIAPQRSRRTHGSGRLSDCVATCRRAPCHHIKERGFISHGSRPLAADPSHNPLLWLLGGERRTLEWRNRFLAWLSKARCSPHNRLRSLAWPPNGARIGDVRLWRFLPSINAERRGNRDPTCRNGACRSSGRQTPSSRLVGARMNEPQARNKGPRRASTTVMCPAHDYLSKGCCKRRFVCPTQADARKIALSWRRRSRRRCSLRRGRPTHSAEPGAGRSAALGGALVHFGICTSSFTCSAVNGAGMNFPATASAIIWSIPSTRSVAMLSFGMRSRTRSTIFSGKLEYSP